MKRSRCKVYVVKYIKDGEEWYSNCIADSKENIYKAYCEDDSDFPKEIIILSIDEVCNHK